MTNALTLLLITAITATNAFAQARNMPDSVMHLNRTGHWAEAAQLARESLKSSTRVEDRCSLRASMLYSLVRTRQLTTAADELVVYDGECAGSQTAIQWTATIAEVRSTLQAPRIPAALAAEGLVNEPGLPPLPATGLDFSYLTPFWNIVDTLSSDAIPSDALWRSFTRSTGFRVLQPMHPDLPELISVAFKPSLRVVRDSLLRFAGERGLALRHLIRALSMRAELTTFADSLTRTASLDGAIEDAGKFLPAGTTAGRSLPLTVFALFRPDGFAGDSQIVLDLLAVRDAGLRPFLAHELHHVFTGAISRVSRVASTAEDALLVNTLIALRNEGIADMIDKPYPLPARDQYAVYYNQLYARTPEILARVDTLLAMAEANPSELRSVGLQISRALPIGGHPTGAYMAREIIQAFGTDSIVAAVYSPFTFLRLFSDAEKQRGSRPPFSAESLRLLAALEKKYTTAR